MPINDADRTFLAKYVTDRWNWLRESIPRGIAEEFAHAEQTWPTSDLRRGEKLAVFAAQCWGLAAWGDGCRVCAREITDQAVADVFDFVQQHGIMLDGEHADADHDERIAEMVLVYGLGVGRICGPSPWSDVWPSALSGLTHLLFASVGGASAKLAQVPEFASNASSSENQIENACRIAAGVLIRGNVTDCVCIDWYKNKERQSAKDLEDAKNRCGCAPGATQGVHHLRFWLQDPNRTSLFKFCNKAMVFDNELDHAAAWMKGLLFHIVLSKDGRPLRLGLFLRHGRPGGPSPQPGCLQFLRELSDDALLKCPNKNCENPHKPYWSGIELISVAGTAHEQRGGRKCSQCGAFFWNRKDCPQCGTKIQAKGEGRTIFLPRDVGGLLGGGPGFDVAAANLADDRLPEEDFDVEAICAECETPVSSDRVCNNAKCRFHHRTAGFPRITLRRTDRSEIHLEVEARRCGPPCNSVYWTTRRCSHCNKIARQTAAILIVNQ